VTIRHGVRGDGPAATAHLPALERPDDVAAALVPFLSG
jgi:hypothetical protein